MTDHGPTRPHLGRRETTRRVGGPRLGRPPGYALAAALLTALFLALLAVAYDVAVRASRGLPAATRANTELAAEAMQGLAWTLDRWPRPLRLLAVGHDTVLTAPASARHVVTVTVLHRGGGTYRVQAEAADLGPGGAPGAPVARVRRELVAVRRAFAPFDVPLVSAGFVRLHNLQLVNGQDTPAGADCSGATLDAPVILLSSRAALLVDSATYKTSVPAPIQTLPALASGAGWQLGGVSVADLAALANVTVPAGAVVSSTTFSSGAGTDSTGDPTCGTWGNPTGTSTDACRTYYPIIHALGPVTLTGVLGQGILVADGSVTLDGASQFWGLIVARSGNVTINGGAVYGQILALDPNGTVELNQGSINRSRCAVDRLVNGLALGRPVVNTPLATLFAPPTAY